MNKEREGNISWTTVECDIWSVGVQHGFWDQSYGEGNWRLIWQLPNKEILYFGQLFNMFVDSYAKYFEENPADALFLTNHFAYVYSYDHICKDEAFNPYASCDEQGRCGQFHHVAINLALTNALGLEFKGSEPIGRYEARFWSPNQIPPYHPELLHYLSWCPTLEDFYTNARKLQIKK